MLDRPRLRRDLSVATVGADKLFVSAGGRHSVIEDTAAVQLAPLLDGRRPVPELMSALGGLPLGRVLGALSTLERMGFLTEGPAEGAEAEAAFWDAAGLDPAAAQRRVGAGTVSVLAAGGADPSRLEDELRRAGLRLGADGEVTLVVVEDHLDAELEEINRRQLAAGGSWVLAKAVGTELWLGPHLRPEGACWACMAERVRDNRQLERYLSERRAERVGSSAAPALPGTVAAAGALLATELATILATGGSPRLDDQLVTLDVLTLETARHAVIRQPQCPECGDPATAVRPTRITLRAQAKGWTDDGGHRITGPHETLRRLSKHVSPITGAVTSVRSQNVEDNGVAYSYAAGHNFALMQDSTFFLRKNLRGRSGGKGRTDTQARVGAICEAIERYDGVYRGIRRGPRAPYEEVADRAVHPAALMMFSERQYAERDAWNRAQAASYHIVPARLEPARPIDWTAAWSLTDERERLVPAGYCWFGHPDLFEHFFCTADGNGNAAGNTIEEAVLQGLLELVERDAVGMWWYNRLRRPAFEVDALGEPYVDLVREHYDRIDRDVWVLDITSDLGIPVFCAVSRRRSGPTEDLLMGFGAHTDVHTAATRAITELNQFLPAVTDIKPDGSTNYWMDDPDAIAWWSEQTLDANPYLRPADGPASRPGDFAPLASDDIAEDVRRLVGRLGEAGHEVIVLDQTRPDIELDVVKVMSPGLRHFWRRLGPGRLYDVPVRMGWLDAPLDEDELNPNSVFF